MQQLASVPVNGTNVHQCDDSHGEEEIELACGCKVPVVAGAWSADGQLKLKEWSSHVTPCCEGRVNEYTGPQRYWIHVWLSRHW